MLGVPPALGRDFQESDDQPNAPFVVHHQRRACGGGALVATPRSSAARLLIQDIPVTVIGVMPRGFENVLSPAAEIWSTLQYDTALPLNGREWGHHLRMVGRVQT